MKIAVTGKGGVGKTTVTALIGRVLKDLGKSVLFIDADPDMNLATVTGFPPDRNITPITHLKELIAERTGVIPGQPAPIFKMNPKVDDIPDKYCVEHDGYKLMVMGTIKTGGGGCACPENAFLKSLLGYMVIERDEWVLLDMEAGIEHLGRGTAIGVDHMIIVVEPSKTSIETAYRIKKLTDDINIRSVQVVCNKVQSEDDRAFIENALDGFTLLGYMTQSDDIRNISLGRMSPGELDGRGLGEIKAIVDAILGLPLRTS